MDEKRFVKSPVFRTVMLILAGMGLGVGVFVVRYGLRGGTVSEIPPLPTFAQNMPASAAETPTSSDDVPYPQIFIPSAGVSEYIIESRLTENGWQVDHLGHRVGHLQGTTPVGDVGNIVLAGHVENAAGEPSVFAALDTMQAGERITIMFQGSEFHYRVIEVKTVASDDLSVVYPVADSERLTLITCTGYNLAAGVYEQRVVVIAERSAG